MKLTERYPYLLHALVWGIWVLWPYVLVPFLFNPRTIIFLTSNTGIHLVFFYLNLFCLTPKLIKDKQGWFFILAVAGCLMIMLGWNWLLTKWLFDGQGYPHRVLKSVVAIAFAASISSILALVRDNNLGQEEKQHLLLEKTSNELMALKLQISPHFLFNTLNNIRWLARQKSDKTESSVVQLSQLLRYMLYKASDEKVPLSDEVEYIKNYLSLQQIRLTDLTNISFKSEGTLSSLLIEPLLFIPFVENAFKYGVDNVHRSNIHVRLVATGTEIYFECENPILITQPVNTGQVGGIGIKNVERRLALNYPNHYRLDIQEQGSVFRVKLILQL